MKQVQLMLIGMTMMSLYLDVTDGIKTSLAPLIYLAIFIVIEFVFIPIRKNRKEGEE